MWHRWGFLNVQWTVETVTIFHEFFTFYKLVCELSYWPLSLFLFVSVGASTALIIRRSSQIMEPQTQRQRPLKAKGQTLRTPWRFKNNTEASGELLFYIFYYQHRIIWSFYDVLGFIFLLFWFLFVFCHPIYLHVYTFPAFSLFHFCLPLFPLLFISRLNTFCCMCASALTNMVWKVDYVSPQMLSILAT